MRAPTPATGFDDPDQTIQVVAPLASDLLRANAGRIFGDMLDRSTIGAEQEGDCIGAFHLCKLLGEGGFGTIWEAEQIEPVRRRVALKIIKRGMDTMQVLARFEQERQVLANLDHPNVASFIHAGASQDGRPYFAMELVKGTQITHWCAEHSSSVQERLRLLICVCLAVQSAHQKGIIHRDLKPSNILVTQIDKVPTPKVIDFGIAKALRANEQDSHTELTQANQIIGTPSYMSPEQMEESSVIDTRTDIYSLGVLLYELMTGSLPFGLTTSTHEMRRLVRQTTPLRPSSLIRHRSQGSVEKPRRSQNISFSSDLDWIILRALEKDCARRYQTVAELAADLQRFLNNEPVLACPPSFAYVTSRWIRRHRAAAVAGCLIVCATVGGSAVAFWQAQIARQAQHQAEADAEMARQAQKQAKLKHLQSQQTAAFVTGLLDRVSQEVGRGRNPEALKAALADSDREILKLSTDPALRIDLLGKIESLYSSIGESKLAIPLALSKARELARLHGPDSDPAFQAELKYIQMVIDFGARATGPDLLEDLLRRVDAVGGHGSKFWFDVQRQIVRAWTKLKYPSKALAAADAYLKEASVKKMTARSLVTIQLSCIEALDLAGRYADAEARLEQCRVTLIAAGDMQRLADVDKRLLHLLWSQQEFARGADLLREQVAQIKVKSGDHSRELIPKLIELVYFEKDAQQNSEAVAHAQEAESLAREIVAALPGSKGSEPSRSDLVLALMALATSESAAKRHDSAILHAQEARGIASDLGNSGHLLKSLEVLAVCQRSAGHLEAAYAAYQEHIEQVRISRANYKDLLDDLEEMCTLRQDQGRMDEALELAQRMWREVKAEKQADPEVTGHVAGLVLFCWKAVKKDRPETPAPAELASWTAAWEEGKKVSVKRQTLPPGLGGLEIDHYPLSKP